MSNHVAKKDEIVSMPLAPSLVTYFCNKKVNKGDRNISRGTP